MPFFNILYGANVAQNRAGNRPKELGISAFSTDKQAMAEILEYMHAMESRLSKDGRMGCENF